MTVNRALLVLVALGATVTARTEDLAVPALQFKPAIGRACLSERRRSILDPRAG